MGNASLIETEELDRRIDALAESVVKGSATAQQRADFGTLSALRARLLLPPAVHDIKEFIRRERLRR